MKQLRIYTDGSCLGNPGNGGYGVVMHVHPHEGESLFRLSGGYTRTTNNRMELMAAIVALEQLVEFNKSYDTRIASTIITDSQYVKTVSLFGLPGGLKMGGRLQSVHLLKMPTYGSVYMQLSN